MREIKFRAWHPTKGMFTPEEMGADQLTIMPDGRGFVNISGDSVRRSEFMTYMIPMQYTGLLDKNGVEIYEGDIVHIDSSPQEDNKIEYCEGIYMLLPHGLYLSDWYKFVEVIGNIYSNPELIDSS